MTELNRLEKTFSLTDASQLDQLNCMVHDGVFFADEIVWNEEEEWLTLSMEDKWQELGFAHVYFKWLPRPVTVVKTELTFSDVKHWELTGSNPNDEFIMIEEAVVEKASVNFCCWSPSSSTVSLRIRPQALSVHVRQVTSLWPNPKSVPK